MARCCDPTGYDRMFDARFARRKAARYRKRGLDSTARLMVDAVAERGLGGATVLEIGGGVGQIQLELLRRGAERATSLELSPAYDDAASELLREAGLADRVDRRILDITADPAAVEPADVVVLHRVVCCFPDYELLLGVAAEHARRQLVFSYPPRNLATRCLVAGQHFSSRLRRCGFRVYAHRPEAMLEVLADHGMRPAAGRRGGIWRFAAVTR